jgi:hypothetical protein
VAWHPGSVYDNYLAVLMSDNNLRIYNIDDFDDGHVKAEQVPNFKLASTADFFRSYL